MLAGEQLDVALDQLARGRSARVAARAGGPPRSARDPAARRRCDRAAAPRRGGDAGTAAARSGGSVARQQELAEPLERGQRRAQLVRDHREELGLRLVELAQSLRRRGDLVLELLGEAALAQRQACVLESERQVQGDFAGRRRVDCGSSPARSTASAPVGPFPESSGRTRPRIGVGPASPRAMNRASLPMSRANTACPVLQGPAGRRSVDESCPRWRARDDLHSPASPLTTSATRWAPSDRPYPLRNHVKAGPRGARPRSARAGGQGWPAAAALGRATDRPDSRRRNRRRLESPAKRARRASAPSDQAAPRSGRRNGRLEQARDQSDRAARTRAEFESGPHRRNQIEMPERRTAVHPGPPRSRPQ